MKKKETQISNQFLVWDGVFSSWEEAIRSAGDVDGKKGFSNEKWFERILEQLSSFRLEIKEFGIAVPPRPTNLPMIVSLTNSKIIVDFGGSSGWIYDYLDSIEFPSKIKKYSILEIPGIVSRSKRFNHSRKVQFYTDFKKIPFCDLLYTNSVIQYFPTNEYLIEIIDQVKPKYILVDDLYAGDNDEFFSNQISYEKKIPHRFLNFKKFREEVSKEGYRLILKQPFNTPILGKYQPKPMDHFPQKYRLRYSLSVVFEKVT
ncbi:methyltransferase, TIGR04325 family [Leptospira borgpetersenii]|uniref:methyltransferase, TIGR04325 family n=1 Tax=Leptospira borgpetersenii TaxID=174 RepID=UPI00029859B6|nr:methyltransferase, TIGR04325 family [Leptospira borgpetersenii]EMO08147.1 methyltransferase, TIGR04325 family [Leptospira borgpetersenii str. Noumea 25]EKQ99162.1 methyltransferase, TIGR04325 family [Leptospira borgpetersenii serovar Castellonis str. 200801910]KGE24544.1 methyltransferase [Leptospira borgpetersenii serovar Ballum]MBE8159741.1 methyltransferase, TIGR04325 family [Leptospira borgpetersenii serovar Ballum]MBE8164237.1 methyltransferase, TIGR04325 family [Leptospira borgpeterse